MSKLDAQRALGLGNAARQLGMADAWRFINGSADTVEDKLRRRIAELEAEVARLKAASGVTVWPVVSPVSPVSPVSHETETETETVSGLKPWERVGVSKATWYRRQKVARLRLKGAQEGRD